MVGMVGYILRTQASIEERGLGQSPDCVSDRARLPIYRSRETEIQALVLLRAPPNEEQTSPFLRNPEISGIEQALEDRESDSSEQLLEFQELMSMPSERDASDILEHEEVER